MSIEEELACVVQNPHLRPRVTVEAAAIALRELLHRSALISELAAALEELIKLCRRGPMHALPPVAAIAAADAVLAKAREVQQ